MIVKENSAIRLGKSLIIFNKKEKGYLNILHDSRDVI